MHDEPTGGGLPLPPVADIQEGPVAACNDPDRLRVTCTERDAGSVELFG